MNNASDLTKAIKEKLLTSASMVGVKITRSAALNRFPALMPWVGIYPGSVDTDPFTLGSRSRGKRWKETMEPKLVLQVANLSRDGEKAADDLEDLINRTLLVLDTDLTMGLQGVRLVGASREYSYVQTDEDEEGDIFFPQCEITLTVETRPV